MRINSWLILGTLLATSVAAQNTAQMVNLTPGPATVRSENLNLRGQAGTKGEVVGRLKRGDTVMVISQINLDRHAADEPAQWAKIALPADIKVWVNTHYVDKATQTVTAKRLNLRAGPGENFSVLGVVEKDTKLEPLATKGDWMQIAAPANTYAFAAAMFLSQEPGAVANNTANQLPRWNLNQLPSQPPTAPVVTPPPTMIEPGPMQPVTQVQPPPVVQPVQPVQPPPPLVQPAPPQITANVIPAPTVITPAEATNIVPPVTTPDLSANQGPRVVSHEGYVRGAISLIAPTAYELFDWDSGRTINYLYAPTTDLDLSRYKGYKIIATGEEALSDRWGATPVLTVQKIFVTATNLPVDVKTIASPRAGQQTISGTKPLQRH